MLPALLIAKPTSDVLHRVAVKQGIGPASSLSWATATPPARCRIARRSGAHPEPSFTSSLDSFATEGNATRAAQENQINEAVDTVRFLIWTPACLMNSPSALRANQQPPGHGYRPRQTASTDTTVEARIRQQIVNFGLPLGRQQLRTNLVTARSRSSRTRRRWPT